MQKIKKKIKTEIEVFVAEDGKEFKTQTECESYERKLHRGSLLNEVKKIEMADIDMAPMGYSYIDTDHYTYVWFRPKSKKEIAALNEYFGFSFSAGISPDSIGNWVGIEFEGGSDVEDFDGDAWLFDFDDSLRNTVEFYTALGYSIEISRADTGEAIASSKDNGG